ncbi:MAG: VWA domain-containing protein [Bacteroidia bacterium]|nr:VWA domain-containing protein [Bacteroidia bacterium]
MFLQFFYKLRLNGIKVSLMEYLALLASLEKEIIGPSIEEFYFLCRSLWVKQEGQLDAFDVLFGQYFRGKEGMGGEIFDDIPEEWLRAELEKVIDPEDLAAIESLGGLEALMDRFKELMEKQEERTQGGSENIGTAGTSPFGNNGFNPEGWRMGQAGSRYRNALKVWDKRQFANLNDKVELNTRNIKMVLKRLRVLTREGREDELDIDKTIRSTSENAGYLDIKMRPSRRNRVKVLLLLDVGGSMDDHVELCSELFSAARHEFKHLEYYYFHNCLYEHVWKDNRRRFSQKIPTWELINTYNEDYKVIWVGDAAMSTTEIMYRGGSVEHFNEETGMEWLLRMKQHFPFMAWINPNPAYQWRYYESTAILRRYMGNKMFPMTLEGIQLAMKALKDGTTTYKDNDEMNTYR